MSQIVTAAQIKAIAGAGARGDLVAAIVKGWPTAVAKAKLTTKARACHFLAQIMTETGGLQILSESGAYRAAQISKIFGVGNHSAGITSAEAARIAALPVAQRGPVLFNRVYGTGNPKKMREFNNTGPNDGWLYRGGGMMQCTGKSNYAAMAKKTGLPLVEHPELLHVPDSAFVAAYLEWAQDGRCNAAADRDDVVAVRKVINGGTNGIAECRKFLAKAKSTLGSYGPDAVVQSFMSAEDDDVAAEAKDSEDTSPEPATTGDEVLPATVNSVPVIAATDPAIIGDAELFGVKARLRAMNYTPGVQNGLWGGMTAGAIAGFVNDRAGFIAAPTSLEAFHEVVDDLKAEMSRAEAETPSFKRPVTEERAKADPKTVAAVAPEIVPAKRGLFATISAAVVSFLTAIWTTVSDWIISAWDFLTDHKDDLPSADSGIATKAMDYVHKVPIGVWFVLAAAIFGLLAWNARTQVKKITAAVQTGARQ